MSWKYSFDLGQALRPKAPMTGLRSNVGLSILLAVNGSWPEGPQPSAIRSGPAKIAKHSTSVLLMFRKIHSHFSFPNKPGCLLKEAKGVQERS
jgi:hypothetical protein